MDKAEAEALAKEIWLHYWKWPVFNEEVDAKVLNQIELVIQRLENGEPLQHILEKAWFCGMEWKVNSHVLVPRPETEELVYWILETKDQAKKSILDLGTGSGCIAVSLAKLGNWHSVSALDISEKALETAIFNSEKQKVLPDFFRFDILSEAPIISGLMKWDIMVSNPPYVLQTEANEMEKTVLDFEPHLALFVPDLNPLLFYEKIGKLGQQQLEKDGWIFFEINPKLGPETCQLLEKLGYSNIQLRQDIFGKDRMIKAQKP